MLASGMTNPRLMQAVDELRKNPKEAHAKYRNDPEVQAFFAEFSKTMGNHFGELGRNKQEEFEKTIEEDPEIQEILKDARVRELIEDMKQGKPIDFHSIVYRDQELAFKFKRLIDKGLIKVQL